MRDPDPHELLRQLTSDTTDERRDAASHDDLASDRVSALVTVALLAASSEDLLADAIRLARTTGDRQLVAIAAAYRAGDHERVDALARDHLLDHPSRPVLTWIVGRSRAARRAGAAAREPREDPNPRRRP